MTGRKIISIEAPDQCCERVREMVRRQHLLSEEIGLPRYGFPSSLLLDVPEIEGWAVKMARDNGLTEYLLYYRFGKVVLEGVPSS